MGDNKNLYKYMGPDIADKFLLADNKCSLKLSSLKDYKNRVLNNSQPLAGSRLSSTKLKARNGLLARFQAVLPSLQI